jgi:hypothetical protein
MIGYIIIIIIIGIIVSIITEQMLIRRLKLEEGVTISKGKCILKPGYGLIPPPSTTSAPVTTPPGNELFIGQITGRDHSGIGRNNFDSDLNGFYKSTLK